MCPLKMFTLARMVILAVVLLQQIVPTFGYYPPQWIQICNQLSPGSERAHSPVLVNLHCLIPRSQHVQWKLNDLRAWTVDKKVNHMTTPTNRTVIYNITVTCEPGANISLPWPMRVPGLRELHVLSCHLLDKYINIDDAIDPTISDDIKILEIRHCTYVENIHNKLLKNSLNMSNDFDCGQDSSIETYIASDITYKIVTDAEPEITTRSPTANPVEGTTKPVESRANSSTSSGPARPEDRLIKDTTKVISDNTNIPSEETDNGNKTNKAEQSEDTKMINSRFSEKSTGLTDKEIAARLLELALIEFRRNLEQLTVHCNYEKLKVLDESIAVSTPLSYFENMVKLSLYPLLEVMNYSLIGLKEMPRELLQWRSYFPKLKYLDLSHNEVEQVKVHNSRLNGSVGVVTFNFRFNNITAISMDILRSWASVDEFFVDVRDNPINCGCDIASLLPHLAEESTFVGRLEPYEYVKYLKCRTPKELRGRELHTLTTDSLQCPPTHRSYNSVVIVLCILISLIVVITVVIIKFKVEIRILLYTRCHVRFPCDKSDARENTKNFDAFVSYCNEDYVWVFENVVKVLENSTNEIPRKANRTSNHSNSGEAAIGQRCLRLCIHQRDFVPGKTIFDNIVDCIQASRHTIIVLSPSFLRSHWAMEELRQAYRQSLAEKTRHLIIILLKKVPDDEMDPLIRRCCKTFTYLDASDRLFKDRLLFSLASKSRHTEKRNSSDTRGNKLTTQSDAHVYHTTVSDAHVYHTTVSDANVYDTIGAVSVYENTSVYKKTKTIR